MVDLSESLLQLRPALTSAHHAALLMATSLQSLCVCLRFPSVAANSMIAAIATLRRLRRLHLIVRHTTDLRPLAQLRCLEDFALQSGHDAQNHHIAIASCVHVLRSSGNTLQAVQLNCFELTDGISLALQRMPHLQTIMLKLSGLSTFAATRIGRLTAVQSADVWLVGRPNGHLIEPSAFAQLGRTVTCLTLEGMYDQQIQSLQPMESLHTLRLLRCTNMTGEGMCLQPGLKCLTFVNCFSISTAGVQNMVQAFCNMQIIAFMTDQYHSEERTLCLSQKALVAMTSWRHARVMDLRGVSHVAKSSIQAMQTSLLAHAVGNSAGFPMVFVSNQADGAHLPALKFSNHKYEPSVYLRPRASCCGRKAWSKHFAMPPHDPHDYQIEWAELLYMLDAGLCVLLFPQNWVLHRGLFLCQLLARVFLDRPVMKCYHDSLQIWLAAGLFRKPIVNFLQAIHDNYVVLSKQVAV